jgi:hypothetical protein
MLSENPYTGNNSGDYQPPTDSPQDTQTNLQQTGDGSSQNSGAELNQQSLPSVNSLKVLTVQNGSTSTIQQARDFSPASQTWVGPLWGSIFLLIIGVIVWAVRIIAKEEVPQLSEVLEQAIKEPIIELPKEEAPEPTANAKNPNKKKVNKSKKATKRKRRSK